MLILATGASGKAGRHFVARLLSDPQHPKGSQFAPSATTSYSTRPTEWRLPRARSPIATWLIDMPIQYHSNWMDNSKAK